jgi:hypothetical protein
MSEVKRIKEIKELIEKHSDKIGGSDKGKIEINFCGKKLNISITVFDEVELKEV